VVEHGRSVGPLEREEPGLGVEQVADPLGTVVVRRGPGHEEGAGHRRPRWQGQLGGHTDLLEPELRHVIRLSAGPPERLGLRFMAALIEAINIKRKMFFEHEGAPYHALDVEVSRPTARGGQTLVRIKMRNLITRAVFDRTFKAGEKFSEPDLELVSASYLYSDAEGCHFMDQQSFDTLTLRADVIGDDIGLLADNVVI